MADRWLVGALLQMEQLIQIAIALNNKTIENCLLNIYNNNIPSQILSKS